MSKLADNVLHKVSTFEYKSEKFIVITRCVTPSVK